MEIIAIVLLALLLYFGDMYVYIIDHYNPSDRIIDLASHTTYVVCVLILYIQTYIIGLYNPSVRITA